MIPKNIREERVPKAIKRTDRFGAPRNRKSRKFHRHNERCQQCKGTIETVLRNIYGSVKRNHKFEIGTRPDDYRASPFYKDIEAIFKELQNYRNHKDFIKRRTLPPCDFFVPEPGIIIEFDESQHFTFCRKLSLLLYPEDLAVGFSLKKWIELCDIINAKDNNPPYRDEQRAWYDTLRDFLPTTKGLKPTVRLFSRDFQWCSMNPENPSHLKIFKAILEGKEPWWKIDVRRGEQNPSIARIIIHSPDWYGEPETAKQILNEICQCWPKDIRVKFIIIGGGFSQFNWPNNIGKKEIGDNLNPNPEAIEALKEEAEKRVSTIIDDQLYVKLRKLSNYITLGVDSKNYADELHVEFVCLVDLINKEFYLTGKSYPTKAEERRLVRVPDLESHFIKLGDGNVMVLGCHDLTIFHPRSDAKALGWRKELKEEFKRIAMKKNPTIVLHHPHTTGCKNVWGPALSSLTRMLNNLEIYASAGRWPHSSDHLRKGGGKHCTFDDVRGETRRGNSIDFIVMRSFCV